MVLGFCGVMARTVMEWFPRMLVAFQLSPTSELLNTPADPPAYTVLGVRGSTARAEMSVAGIPTFSACQLAAASTLLNTPRSVPAYIVLGSVESITRALTYR